MTSSSMCKSATQRQTPPQPPHHIQHQHARPRTRGEQPANRMCQPATTARSRTPPRARRSSASGRRSRPGRRSESAARRRVRRCRRPAARVGRRRSRAPRPPCRGRPPVAPRGSRSPPGSDRRVARRDRCRSMGDVVGHHLMIIDVVDGGESVQRGIHDPLHHLGCGSSPGKGRKVVHGESVGRTSRP